MLFLTSYNKLGGNKHWCLQGRMRKESGCTGPVQYQIPGSLVSAGSRMSVCWHPPFPSHKWQTHWQVQPKSGACAGFVHGISWLSYSTLQCVPLSIHLLEKSREKDRLRSSSTYSYMNDVGDGSHRF